MDTRFQRIAPLLRFDDNAEQAVDLHFPVVDDTRIVIALETLRQAAP